MEKHLFISCFIVFGLYLSVLLALFVVRVRDVQSGRTDARFFKTYDFPTEISNLGKQLTRNYSNLFEAPTLFFAIIALILALKLHHPHFVILAYSYAGLRVAHSVIHVTVNKIHPRMFTFFLSTAALAGLWVRALLSLLEA